MTGLEFGKYIEVHSVFKCHQASVENPVEKHICSFTSIYYFAYSLMYDTAIFLGHLRKKE